MSANVVRHMWLCMVKCSRMAMPHLSALLVPIMTSSVDFCPISACFCPDSQHPIPPFPAPRSSPYLPPIQVPKANVNKHLKKQVAQLLTVIRERQLVDGITRKEAIQIETAVALSKGMAFK